MSVGRRYITDCKTGKLSIKDGDAGCIAEREQTRLDAPKIEAEITARIARNEKIQTEATRIAEQSLIDKGEIEAK